MNPAGAVSLWGLTLADSPFLVATTSTSGARLF